MTGQGANKLFSMPKPLNETYDAPWRPFVHIKAGMSLDGRIATAAGRSQWITSEEARIYAHTLRKRYDAILAGIGTILADDPQLNVRLGEGVESPIHRVIVDGSLRTPKDARLFSVDAGGGILIATREKPDREKAGRLTEAGAEIIPCPEDRGKVDLQYLLRELKAREICSLMVEGGGEIIASFLRRELADKVTFVLAPIIIGGHNSIPVVGGDDIEELADAVGLISIRSFSLGPDIAIEGYLKR